jgi:hypothetical protein
LVVGLGVAAVLEVVWRGAAGLVPLVAGLEWEDLHLLQAHPLVCHLA